jgi:catechol 2,3-dioxygenase
MTNATRTASIASPISEAASLTLSHMGIYVRELEKMGRFYREVLGFTETDRGDLGPVQLIFLTRDPSEHHQIVLVSGRPAEATYSVINQLSFRVQNLTTLKYVHARALAEPGVSDMVPVTHGNAISIYFRDPEGNRIEVFLDTPWYCEQPLREPVDLSLSDQAIMAHTEALARSRPKFGSREKWQIELSKLMGANRSV